MEAKIGIQLFYIGSLIIIYSRFLYLLKEEVENNAGKDGKMWLAL